MLQKKRRSYLRKPHKVGSVNTNWHPLVCLTMLVFCSNWYAVQWGSNTAYPGYLAIATLGLFLAHRMRRKAALLWPIRLLAGATPIVAWIIARDAINFNLIYISGWIVVIAIISVCWPAIYTISLYRRTESWSKVIPLFLIIVSVMETILPLLNNRCRPAYCFDITESFGLQIGFSSSEQIVVWALLPFGLAWLGLINALRSNDYYQLIRCLAVCLWLWMVFTLNISATTIIAIGLCLLWCLWLVYTDLAPALRQRGYAIVASFVVISAVLSGLNYGLWPSLYNQGATLLRIEIDAENFSKLTAGNPHLLDLRLINSGERIIHADARRPLTINIEAHVQSKLQESRYQILAQIQHTEPLAVGDAIELTLPVVIPHWLKSGFVAFQVMAEDRIITLDELGSRGFEVSNISWQDLSKAGTQYLGAWDWRLERFNHDTKIEYLSSRRLNTSDLLQKTFFLAPLMGFGASSEQMLITQELKYPLLAEFTYTYGLVGLLLLVVGLIYPLRSFLLVMQSKQHNLRQGLWPVMPLVCGAGVALIIVAPLSNTSGIVVFLVLILAIIEAAATAKRQRGIYQVNYRPKQRGRLWKR